MYLQPEKSKGEPGPHPTQAGCLHRNTELPNRLNGGGEKPKQLMVLGKKKMK